jgi:hypothetical protein
VASVESVDASTHVGVLVALSTEAARGVLNSASDLRYTIILADFRLSPILLPATTTPQRRRLVPHSCHLHGISTHLIPPHKSGHYAAMPAPRQVHLMARYLCSLTPDFCTTLSPHTYSHTLLLYYA